jgi:uncharacterized protein
MDKTEVLSTVNLFVKIIVIVVDGINVNYERKPAVVAAKWLNMRNIMIAGGTGLVGTRLQKILMEKGFSVIILTRKLPASRSSSEKLRYALWDTEKGTIDAWAIKESDGIINLSGAGVAEKRWTEARKEEILTSRVNSGNTLVKALQEIPNKVEVVINASAIGWYGPDPVVPNPHPFTESDPFFHDFLGQTCQKWEQSIEPVEGMGKRLVLLRIGIVLSNLGGALAEFKKPLQFGIAATLGSGKQVISWIHIDDLCGLFLKAITDPNMRGAYNAVAPVPVNNQTLTNTLARLTKKFWIPSKVPSFVLKWMLGEMSIEVLKSTTVSASKAIAQDFQFKYPTIEEAIKQLSTNPKS